MDIGPRGRQNLVRSVVPRRSRTPFRDRAAAGRELARALEEYADRPDVVVLGLPRGGVPVAFEVARELRAPLDVFVVRKLGLPGQPELAIGAIASGGIRVLNEQVIAETGLGDDTIDAVTEREQRELERRERLYRGGREVVPVEGRTVLLVDDGLATGSTMRAALAALLRRRPGKLVVAVPVAPLSTCAELRREAVAVICLHTPRNFLAVGAWYTEFPQTSDAEIQELLAQVSFTGEGAG
jgi:putative phosphoribosyl transferase